MRKLDGNRGWWQQELKDVPKGVCSLCGGKGRYKKTFKHKNPVIHHCLPCKGTGNVKVRVTYVGESDQSRGLWSGSTYDVVSESESDYVIVSHKKEMLQITKEVFKLI